MKKIIIALGALVAITANAQQTATTEPVQQTVQSVQTTQNNTVQTTAAPVEEAKPTTLEGVFQQLKNNHLPTGRRGRHLCGRGRPLPPRRRGHRRGRRG